MAYQDPVKLEIWREANKEHIREQARENARKYRQDPEYRAKNSEIKKKYRKTEAYKAKFAEFYMALKTEVFSHYSGSTPKCAICGEDRLVCLSIDHIGGGGSIHRREIKKTGWSYWAWLRDNGYPQGYRILCMNCQFVTYAEIRRKKKVINGV